MRITNRKISCLTIVLLLIGCQNVLCEGVLHPIGAQTNNGIGWGYINSRGDEIVKPIYQSATDFRDGVGIVYWDQAHFGGQANSVSPTAFESGIVDSDGNVTWLANTLIIADFSEGLAFANVNGKWSFIDKKGKSAIPVPSYLRIDEEAPLSFGFANGVAAVNSGNGIYLVTKTGKFHKRSDIISIIGILNGTECVLVREGFTLIGASGRRLVKPQRNPINYSDEGLFLFETASGEWRYVDYRGKKVVEVPYDYAGLFSQGLAVIEIDRKWGYMNKVGEIEIEPQFQNADHFGGEGLAAVKLDNKYGFINKAGDFAITPSFDYVQKPFSNGLALVQKDDFLGYIDTAGKWIWKRNIRN